MGAGRLESGAQRTATVLHANAVFPLFPDELPVSTCWFLRTSSHSLGVAPRFMATMLLSLRTPPKQRGEQTPTP